MTTYSNFNDQSTKKIFLLIFVRECLLIKLTNVVVESLLKNDIHYLYEYS